MSEWVEVIKQSVVGIIISIVIGAALGFIYMSMASANRNKDELATTLAAAEQKKFQAYDGTMVTGEVVRSAISQFENTETAIFVQTAKSGGKYSNFCAVAEGVSNLADANGSVPVKLDKDNGVLMQEDGEYLNLLPGDNGEAFKQSSFKVALTSKTNHKMYINPTSQFYGCVLRDENGTIKGIAFLQSSVAK